ncbi:uncharacterized protein N7487_008224 [Penicillium crustosum]|uniref:uncharacterized protein n=1 Tax=Penicillium crustosum TaxID=36656 RepID=UPI0023A66C31|nr:uncharacterized protein N7487_008224 [Penicillium crustosum]KAJ5402328.1 hypothetical protein N7487_008224 [Penicillium crustosum]
MPSYRDDPPDQEYLDSIKRHTDKETNKVKSIEGACETLVNLALVGKDFGYASGKSFQKKYAKLKKAHNLTNGHIYGDYRAPAPSVATTSVDTASMATTSVAAPETDTSETATTEESDYTSDVERFIRNFVEPWSKGMMERAAEERAAEERAAEERADKEHDDKKHDATKKGKSPTKEEKH